MSRKTDDLQWQIDRLTNRVMCLEDRIYAMERKWDKSTDREITVAELNEGGED